MQLYLDSAKLDEIKKLSSLGLIHGVTTNPSLIKIAAESMPDKPDLESYIKELQKAFYGPLSVEVISTDRQSMYREAMLIKEKFGMHNNNVVVKIPICTAKEMDDKNWDSGLEIIKSLSLQNIPVNTTLVLSPSQALLAANAGAKYVSPFAGRLDDYLVKAYFPGTKRSKSDYFPREGMTASNSKDVGTAIQRVIHGLPNYVNDDGTVSGVHLVGRIVTVLKNSNLDCKVLAASLRNPRQVVEMAEVGADIATVDYNTIVAMAMHQVSCDGIRRFAQDTIEEYRKLFTASSQQP